MTASFGWGDVLRVEAIVRQVAAVEVVPRYRRLAAEEIGAKSRPDDLVTIADVEAERRLRAELAAAFPGSEAVGEESEEPGHDYARAPLSFVIDPVDGTWNFANDLPIFGTIVAVLSFGRTIGGIIHYPLEGDSLVALQGAGVKRVADGTATVLRPAPCPSPQPAAGLLPLSIFAPAERIELVRRLGHVPRIVTIQCSAYEYRLLAMGQVDFCISTGLRPWDHAAGQLILAAFGGVGRLLDGGDYAVDAPAGGRLVSARSPALWKSVTQALGDFR